MASPLAEALESSFLCLWMASSMLLLALWAGQSDEVQPYAREADRVEQEFRAYRDRLNALFVSLRGMIDQQPASAAAMLRLQQQDAPPPSPPALAMASCRGSSTPRRRRLRRFRFFLQLANHGRLHRGREHQARSDRSGFRAICRRRSSEPTLRASAV